MLGELPSSLLEKLAPEGWLAEGAELPALAPPLSVGWFAPDDTPLGPVDCGGVDLGDCIDVSVVEMDVEELTAARSKILTLTSTEYGKYRRSCRGATSLAGPRRRPILASGSSRERPLTVMFTLDPPGWFRGTMPETNLPSVSRMSHSAAGNFWMDSIRSSGVLSKGLKSIRNISAWKISTLASLLNIWSAARIVYVNPFDLEVARMVMFSSFPSYPTGTVPIKAGGGVGLSFTQSTGGLVVNLTVSSAFRRKSVRLIWKSPPMSTGTLISEPAVISRLKSLL